MGRQKMIYIDDDVFVKLQDQPNASGLINCLLTDYFKINVRDTASLVSAKELLEQEQSKFVELKQKEVEKIENQINKAKQQDANSEAEKIINQQRMEQRIADCVKNAKEMFNAEITSEEAEQYINGSWNNLKDFLIFLGKWD
jgi:hypothetical protein